MLFGHASRFQNLPVIFGDEFGDKSPNSSPKENCKNEKMEDVDVNDNR